jgi:succinate dehydrogenase/fumarate reductase cytochrome b subunit
MRVNKPSHRRTRLLCAVLGALVLAVLAAAPASAATYVVALAETLDQVLNNIRNWIVGIIAIIATTFVTIGGLRYLAANGDPGEVEKAKAAFRNAAIGFGLAALAPVVVGILKTFVGM